MKKVEAIFRPEKLDDVKNALEQEGFATMSVSELRGRGRQKGVTMVWRGSKYSVDLTRKVKIEIVLRDKDLEKVVSIIKEHAYTGKIGDGKIFIIPIEEALRIRTGEKGEKAI